MDDMTTLSNSVEIRQYCFCWSN